MDQDATRHGASAFVYNSERNAQRHAVCVPQMRLAVLLSLTCCERGTWLSLQDLTLLHLYENLVNFYEHWSAATRDHMLPLAIAP